MAVGEKTTYSVAQINRYIKNMFSQDFMLGRISVRGELSNVKYHGSGHIYFTLKDAGSCINGVMFAGNRGGLKCTLTEGMQVVVTGSIEVYERDGKYQIYARTIQMDGMGALYERFLAMKQELEECGMFSEMYKQPIPKNVKTLGVVTAKTGAAVRDIIQIAKRRNPYLQIIVYPAIVQGDAAVASIVSGIEALQKQNVDVIIVGRGGGSIEDLWAFNERAVAQAIFDCSVPIISAVGHETDTTIADFVADLRAPTPSAAAELAVCEVSLTILKLKQYQADFEQLIHQKISKKRMELSVKQEKLKRLSPESKLKENQMRLANLQENFEQAMEAILLRKRHRLELYIEKYKGNSPLEKLSRGYSYIQTQSGETLKSAKQIKSGDTIHVRLYEGALDAVVQEVKDRE